MFGFIAKEKENVIKLEEKAIAESEFLFLACERSCRVMNIENEHNNYVCYFLLCFVLLLCTLFQRT